ncbi:hypothetical protein PQX77_005485 [Marasmius sp. AFHP31]|nr:hypothetical protein PQX77_005485 [Marasmius sp. AFHP31]
MCPPESFSAATSSVAHDWDTSFVPPSEISQSALKLASSHLGPAILNHSVRVYLYASALAKSSNSIYSTPEKHDLLFTACIMHDIGTCKAYDGPQRFEVEGGDAAAAHLRNFGVDEKDVHEVWVAIALHTSAGIAERIAELAKIVREAVLIDFGRGAGGFDVDVESLRKQFEEKYPRYGLRRYWEIVLLNRQ